MHPDSVNNVEKEGQRHPWIVVLVREGRLQGAFVPRSKAASNPKGESWVVGRSKKSIGAGFSAPADEATDTEGIAWCVHCPRV
ncbi:hypothetical protein GCM10009784_15360 [Arthrobacter parietis]|uniref:Uncharacterized protein n=1 Tax=Arthrobacter parietis TaxID=271434 RepID=A0ABP5MJX7_9MICC